MGRKYEGILDFNQQVDYTFTPITYEMISYDITFNFGAKVKLRPSSGSDKTTNFAKCFD